MLLNFIEGAICGAVLAISLIGLAAQRVQRRLNGRAVKMLGGLAEDIVSGRHERQP